MNYSGIISCLIIAFCICIDFRTFAILDSPQPASTQKKQLKFETGLSREKLQHFNDVPEEVHQKWEQFKQNHCTCLHLLMSICMHIVRNFHINYI